MMRLTSARFLSAIALVLVVQTLSSAATKSRPLTNSKYDPAAEQVELFAAMKDGTIEVKVVPKDEFGGSLLIANKQEAPITVKLPQGFVGVPINAQFGGGGGGNQFGGGGQQGGQQGGGNQSFGGGGGQQGGGQFGGQQGGGGQQGFFSIPAERTLRVPYTSVCLEHGKPSPHPRTAYKIIPVEEYTEDPVLITLVNMVGTGRLDRGSAQAAAWNVANKMSWQQLAHLKYNRVAAPDVPLFTHGQLTGGQNIVTKAVEIAKEEAKPTKPNTTPARVNPRRVR